MKNLSVAELEQINGGGWVITTPVVYPIETIPAFPGTMYAVSTWSAL